MGLFSDEACPAEIAAAAAIPAKGHTLTTHGRVEATCTTVGTEAYWDCGVCHKLFSDESGTSEIAVPAAIPAGHTLTAHNRAEATCTDPGTEAYWECGVCRKLFSDADGINEIPAPITIAAGHKEETIPAVAATCTATGLTEGKKCSVCGKILAAQQTVPAKGHTAVTDPAEEPTYTGTGLTEGSHCSVCGAVLVAQQTVPKKTEPGIADVDSSTFPDPVFRAWVSANADSDKDGRLTQSEIAAVKTADLSKSEDIVVLTGIEYFTSLETLDVTGNKLFRLDVSKLTALRTLRCGGNCLTSLDLSNNTKLTDLTCTGNVYEMKARAGSFDLSTIMGFDIGRASSFSAGTLSGTTLTVSEPGDVTYTYDCGRNFKAVFTLRLKADPVTVSKVTTGKTKYAYTGKPIEPKLTVTAYLEGDGQAVILNESQYEAEYTDNLKAGTATVKVTGKGFFKGTATAEFEITPVKLASATLKYTKTVYTGKALKPTATVKAKVGGKTVTLKSGTDYTLTYKNNTNAGKATVTVKCKGNFTGTLTRTFTITGAPIMVAKVKNASLPYSGKAKTPILIVKAKVGTKTVSLKKDRDYTATYKNNTDVGTATVTVKGIGNYSGTLTAAFNINALKMKNAKAALSDTALKYTGKALKPKPTVTMKIDGKTVTLKSGTDYTVTYRNNKNVGTATVTITGKGNFTGTITLSFNIVKK